MKRASAMAFILSLFFLSSFAIQVDVNVNIGKQETIFEYIFTFEEGEVDPKFSLEKPQDGQLLETKDPQGESIPYSVAGDFFILKPKIDEAGQYSITFESEQTSQEVFSKKTFSNYVNLNFPVKNFTYSLFLGNEVEEVLESFPRDSLEIDGSVLKWRLASLEEETLFFLKFAGEVEPTETTTFGFILLALLVLPVLFFVILFIYIRKAPSDIEEEKKPSRKEEEPKKEEREQSFEEFYEEFIHKYLTENEQDVVGIVKEHPGIQQYDVLNYLPSFTKSNLSKIISKLHSKKILNRIKVGKINKIYLGERLEKQEEKESEESSKETE